MVLLAGILFTSRTEIWHCEPCVLVDYDLRFINARPCPALSHISEAAQTYMNTSVTDHPCHIPIMPLVRRAPPLINLLCPGRAVIQGHESLCCWWFPTALHFADFRLAAFLPGFRMDICEALQRFLFIASSSVPSDAQEEPGDLSRWAGHVAWGATTADDQTDWCRRKLQEYWRCGIWKSQLEEQGTHSYTNKHFQEQLSWKNLKYENDM